MNLNKSIKQLDKNDWGKPKEFATGLVERCYDYVNIPIGELNIEQLRTLITQKIGTEFLIPVIINKLKINILAEGDFYPGDLLEATLSLDDSFWNKFNKEKLELKSMIGQNEKIIIEELGEKIVNRFK